ncbi:rhodanese-like domain-containing protein [Azospirillum sp.]|uniref:rhodanese-like domain-containing protein n=1 Tax=Azospirillum sp. TaxID=34012 RepID=UPI003D706349
MKSLLSLFGLKRGQSALNTQVRTVDPATVMGWLKEGTATIVDVREPHEHRAAHIPGAILVPLSQFDPRRVPVEPGKHLVFHCQSGRRCGPASARLAESGYTGEINRLNGGMNGWLAASGPVER